MPFFDFHVHVTLKSFLSVPPLKLGPWTHVPESHIPGRICKDIAVYLLSKIQGWFERQFVDFWREIDITLPAGLDVRHFSQQLFFEDGKNFLFTRLALIGRW